MGNRFTFLLLLGALLTIGNVVKAQDVTLSLSPASVTIDTGDMVTIAIFAENFTSVSGFSGTIDWDPNVLSFVEIPPLTNSLSGMATNTSMISQGILLFNWFDLGTGVTVNNTTPIFEIVFDAAAAGVSDVILATTPVPTQVIQGVNEYVPVSTGSTVTVTGPPPPPNDGNFAWDCTDFTELAFYASFDSINTGESTCLDVAVCNFNQITSFGFTMEFDSALLQFDSVANFQLTQLVSGNFGTTNSGQGFVNVAWFEEQGNGIDVADESTIFEICFTAIGPGGSLDSLKFTSTQTTFSAADTSLMPIPVESGNGHVVITGTSNSAVSVFASDETVNVGGNTCVDIMCADFNDMFSMGFTMEWDESIIEYDTILDPNNFFNGAILSSTNTAPGLVDTGALTVTWLSPTSVTLADSTVLFQVCYNAAAAAAPTDVSAVQFTGSQLTIDASQDNGSGNPVSVPLATTDGSVTINPDSNPDGFVFNLSDTTGCEGDTVTISFLATGFENVAIISGQINWDTSQIKWVGLHDAILPPLFTSNTSPAFTDAGKMTFVWFDLDALGKTFIDDTKLFQMDFVVVGSGSQNAQVTFSSADNNMPELLVADANNNALAFSLNSGNIDCSTGTISVTGVVTDVSCNGDSDGAIDITVVGNTDPTNYVWTGPGTFVGSSEDISGLSPGVYNVTIMDSAGLSVTESFTVGEPDALSLSATTMDAICNGGAGGEIDLTVTGGNGNNMFSWDNSLPAQEDQTGLTAGTYCVTVTDENDCTENMCFNVGENAGQTVTAVITDANCADGNGELDLTVSGGSGSFTFAWDNGLMAQEDQTGLASGTYCVTITDTDMCAIDTCFTVGQQMSNHSVTASITDANCGSSDGAIDLSISGGNDPYTFTWDNGLPSMEDQTGLAAGTYCVTITDEDLCTIDSCFTVGSQGATHSVSGSITDASCGGSDGEIDLTVMGGAGGNVFTWDNGLPSMEDQTGLAAGTYCVTVVDANLCEINACYTVGEEDPAHTVTASITDASCGASDGEIDLTPTGGAGGFTFQWDNGLAAQEDQTGLAAGTYCVTIIDANLCEIDSCFMVGSDGASHTVSASITDASCGGSDGAIDLTVMGGAGGNMFQWDSGLPAQEDQTGLSAGVYCVTITDANLCEIQECFTVGEEPADHSLTAILTDAVCGDNGEIDITVVGGSGTFSFVWDSGLPANEDQTGLNPGTYCVTVLDGVMNCAMDSCFTIQDSGPFHTVQAGVTQANCGGSDGAINLAVTGGSGSYTFLWDQMLPANEDQSNLSAGTYCVTITDSSNGCEINDCYTVGDLPPSHTVSADITNESCNVDMDGAIDLTVMGGAGGFMYQWDNGLPSNEDQTGLSAGFYCVTITDANGCEIDECYLVELDPEITLTAEVTDATCNGFSTGEIDLTATGGDGNYTFDWGSFGSNEDLANLMTGTYTVLVSDGNGCSETMTYTIDEPEVLAASAVGNDVTCFGFADGSIDLTVTGGTEDYSFAWDNGAGNDEDPTNLGPGTYTVTVTDNQLCETTTSVVIDEPAALDVQSMVSDESTPGANDGSINLTVTGGIEDYTFNWSGGLPSQEDQTNLSPGTYSVTVMDDNGCTVMESYTINGQTAPAIVDVDITPAVCGGIVGGSIDITVQGGSGNYSFSWAPNGETDEDLIGVPTGNYSVTVTDIDNGFQINGGPYFVPETSNSLTYTETHENTTCIDVFDGQIWLDVSGGSGFYDVDWGGGLVGLTINGLAPGTYTPTVTDVQEGCTLIGAGITILAPESIQINVTNVVHNTCKNDTDGAIEVAVFGGNGGFEVNWGAGGMGLEVTGLAAGTYTPTVTDMNGCVEIGPTVEIDEPSLIRGNAVTGDIACFGDMDGFIDLTPTGGNDNNYSYQWDYNGATTEDLQNIGAGTYTVTISDFMGCMSVEQITINGPSEILPNADVNPASPNDDDGSIVLSTTGGAGNYSYVWLGPGGPYGNTSALIDIASGEYYLTITDGTGCSVTSSYLVPGNLGISGEVFHVSCFGASDGMIIATALGGDTPHSYFWNDPGMSTGPKLNNVGPGTYTVTVNDASGMFITANYTIVEPPEIVISNIDVTNESGNGCNGSIDVEVEGGTPLYEFQWSNGDDNQNPEDLCKGDYIVNVIDANGCVVSSGQINVGPAEVNITNFEVVNEGCPGDASAEVCFDIFGGCAPYNVSIDGGSPVIDLDGSLCIDDLAPGLHTITILDNFGMTVDYPFTIDQPDPIVATTQIMNNNDPDDCNGSINLTVSGGTPDYQYQWSHGPTSEDVGGLCEDLSPYSVTITDSNGCTQVVTDLEIGTGISAFADISDVCALEVCDGSIDITPSGGNGNFTYLWSNDATSQDLFGICGGVYTVTITDTDGLSFEQTYVVESPNSLLEISGMGTDPSSSGGNDGSINIAVTGGYGGYSYAWSNGQETQDIAGLSGNNTYSVTVTDNNGCIAVESFTLGDPEVPMVAIIADEPLCNGGMDGCLEAIPMGGVPPYTYLWSNGASSEKICALDAGEYAVTVTDVDGLVLVEENFILGEPNALQVEIDQVGEGSLFANVIGGTAPYNYNWNAGAGTEAQLDDLPTGQYLVLVTDDNGCSGNATFDLFPEGDCDDLRNIITPNGDGENDAFIIVCAYQLFDTELEIYNRWGQPVYTTLSYANDWTGIDNDGNLLPEGAYYFVFRYSDAGSGIEIEKTGHVTIIR